MRITLSINDSATAGAVDNRMIATIRVVLASSALLIIYLDPSEPDRFAPITYCALILYTLYSALLCVFAFGQYLIARSVEAWAHWADVGWYLLLISLSSGTNSVFFFFFFFSILVASFRWGFASGLRVVIVSSALFCVIGYATAPSGPDFELNRFLLRPIYVLVLGYMMAYWGGSETTLKRRLALLKEVTLLSNPRFGVNRTIGVILERVRAFYDADTCVLILARSDRSEYRLRRTERHDPEAGMRVEIINEELAQQLLALPPGCAAICDRHPGWRIGWPSYHAFDVAKGERVAEGHEACQSLLALLDAEAIVTIPLHYQKEVIGRGFLVSRRHNAFNISDAHFLLHIYEQIMPVIENIMLVDRLASNAAEHERQRIARDIHDSAIQPYIGLQIGLAAINQKLSRGNTDVSDDVRRLIELTEVSISDLRRYMSGLREVGEQEGSLLPSVRRFTAKFAEATGIAVQVEAESDIRINDRLAAEAFQMMAEGLSNIRRHTQAAQAVIGLACTDHVFTLRIENDKANGSEPSRFVPQSIAGRAEALGGETHVERRDDTTVVIVSIPL